MGTKHVLVDAGERDLATAQLDDIARTHAGEPWASWKDLVVEWHVQSVADARAESWIPGMARTHDPAIERALSRFYSYHMRAAIARLKAENTELQRKLIDAVACARFYASGRTDSGERAHSVLAELLTDTSSDEQVKRGINVELQSVNHGPRAQPAPATPSAPPLADSGRSRIRSRS